MQDIIQNVMKMSLTIEKKIQRFFGDQVITYHIRKDLIV